MAIPNEIGIGLVAACSTVVLLYGLAYYLQLAKWEKTKLKQQLYQSGETVTPRKRRYLERTFIWISYFSAVHVVGFMLATLLVLTIIGVGVGMIEIQYPIVYFVITVFAILFLARSQNSLT
ncbi:MAG: hypothetical protein ACFFCQ_03395 [Promethearchaeota archaeon]